MTYTSSNMLGTAFINKNLWMEIYGCILLRGMKNGYRAQNENLGWDIPRG